MSVDLVEFLTARLDEDEQTARRAGDSFRQIGETGVIVATEGDRAEECASANWAGVAEHIARHDPARVLAEVDAKRQIVTAFAEARKRDYNEEPANYFAGVHVALGAALDFLALPYADHPDYDEAWRP
ncbi:DUF6221 family protein [Streptomyces sp. NPDC013457]|uniref:DUF6221 family protein n=1 Tax=Streptomyces sp. NPDC013457 TaxID=3364866 RepID=UPI0036F8C9EC